MAITPNKVLDITEEEKKLLALVEERIDQLLVARMEPGGCVLYPVKKRWRPGFLGALQRRYLEAGWAVVVEEDTEGVSWIRFSHRLSNPSPVVAVTPTSAPNPNLFVVPEGAGE